MDTNMASTPAPAPAVAGKRRGPRGTGNGAQLRRRFLDALGPVPHADAGALDPAGVDAARVAWRGLAERAGWRPSYQRQALSALVRELEPDLPALAQAIQPGKRARRFRDRVVHTQSSHETRFNVQDCLPLCVRHLPAYSTPYQVLFGLAERLLRHCKSACRHTLQKRLVFLHRLLDHPPSLLREDGPPATAWGRLAAVSGLEWLRRLESLYAAGGHSLAARTLKVHVIHIRALHEQLLGPRTDRDTIPMRTGATHLDPVEPADGGDDDVEGDDGTAAAAAADARPGDPDHAAKVRLLGLLERRLCDGPDAGGPLPAPAPARRWAFLPEEVTAVLDAALTTPERLTILLLVTTGLRLGGLCRLRTTTRAEWGHEIPVDALHTVEKGNRPRTLDLLAPVRICLARYFREYQPRATGCLVFPASRDPTRCSVNPAGMWAKVRTVLHRAGIRGPHAHPHTFRHTYVHMMRHLGVPTDIIARMIGHANLQTTERVYSRFDAQELSSLTAAVPIFGGSVAAAQVTLRERWQAVVARINCPYEFSEREWHGLR